MRNYLRTFTAAVAVCAIGGSAYAANVHLVPGHSNPTFTDNGLTLMASGTLAGLGMENATICNSPTVGHLHQPVWQ